MEVIKNVKLCKVDFTLFLRKMCFDDISILSPTASSKKEKKKASQFRRICCSLARKESGTKPVEHIGELQTCSQLLKTTP